MSILVEVFFAPGCTQCAQAREALKAVAAELNANGLVWREIDILKEIDYAVELGIVSPPAVAIDRVLVFTGLPAPERLREELAKRIAAVDQPDVRSSGRGRR